MSPPPPSPPNWDCNVLFLHKKLTKIPQIKKKKKKYKKMEKKNLHIIVGEDHLIYHMSSNEHQKPQKWECFLFNFDRLKGLRVALLLW
jgi:hypothetical protein